MSRIEMRSRLTLHLGLEASQRGGTQTYLLLRSGAFWASKIGGHD
jgi:hypothetical protein